MKRFFLTLLMALAGTSFVYAVKVGDSEDDVRSALGRPNLSRQMANGGALWKFSDGTNVRFLGGKVTEIDGPGVARAIGDADKMRSQLNVNPAPAAPKPKPAPVATAPASPPKKPAVNEKSAGDSGAPKRFSKTVQDFGLVLVILGGVTFIGCRIYLLIIAFGKGVGWGLGSLFIPFFEFAVVVRFWSETKYPIGFQIIVGVPVFVLGVFLREATP